MLNYNVRLALVSTVFDSISVSLCAGDVLASYLFLVTKSQTVVGLLEGGMGVAQLLAALPAGIFTDRYRRDTVLRAAAAFGTIATLWMAWSLVYFPSVYATAVAMLLLGGYRGIQSTAFEAIFADSVEPGNSGPFSLKLTCGMLAYAAGPVVAIVMFWRLGNQWEIWPCRVVLLVGLLVAVPSLVLICFFDDDKALTHHAHDAIDGQEALAAAQDVDVLIDSNGGHVQADKQPHTLNCQPSLVPAMLVIASDLIGALAAGMSMRFFVIWFMDPKGCNISPIAVCFIGLGTISTTAIATMAAQSASKLIGRVQVTLLTRPFDILLLVAMALLPTTHGTTRSLAVAAYLARMAAANAGVGLMKSVLMDNVAKRYRGKVNALESVRVFSWTGSAALGGWLIEKYGYSSTFIITASIKVLAYVPLLFLLPYVPDGIFAGRQTATPANTAESAAAGYEALPRDEVVPPAPANAPVEAAGESAL